MRSTLILLLSIQVLFSGCGLRLGKMSDSRKSERLAIERGELAGIEDPVEKTKSYIRISEILLDFALDSARDGDSEALKPLLDQYTAAIRSARDTMVESDRDAERKPAGYRDLEVAMRRQIRRLGELNAGLKSEERKLAEAALALATSVRDEMVRLLFPQSFKI